MVCQTFELNENKHRNVYFIYSDTTINVNAACMRAIQATTKFDIFCFVLESIWTGNLPIRPWYPHLISQISDVLIIHADEFQRKKLHLHLAHQRFNQFRHSLWFSLLLVLLFSACTLTIIAVLRSRKSGKRGFWDVAISLRPLNTGTQLCLAATVSVLQTSTGCKPIYVYPLLSQRLEMTELLTLMKLVVLIFDLYSAVGSYSSKLYPFGNDAGDENLPDKDDENSPRISTPPLPFFGTNFTALYVSIICMRSNSDSMWWSACVLTV